MRSRARSSGFLERTSGHLQLLFFGLVAALSPMALAATLAVIKAGRLKALGFGAGLVASQFVVCAILVLIGGWAGPDRDHAHPTFRATLELVFGLWVLWLAARARRRPEEVKPGPNPRTKAALERLGRVHVATALAAGLLLGIGGPKRLVLTALASASIASTTGDSVRATVLVGTYTILATLLVWAPIVAFELVGDRAITTIDDVGRWVAARQRRAIVVTLLVVGLAAVVDAVATLL